MKFVAITADDSIWRSVIDYAGRCSWRAGKSLASDMNGGKFSDWERVIVALEGDNICGFCTVTKTDCIPDVEYTPYIGFVFVGEEYRGKRLSEKMIGFAGDYLAGTGFEKVYLVSDHDGLYEKYGFRVIDRKMAPWGSEEKIYMKSII